MFMDSKNISNQSPPKSIYARALIGDGALRWDIPPAISDRNQIFYQRIGTPFHRITECFRECLKTQSQNHFRSLTRQLLSGTRLTNVETWTGVVCELTESLVSNISQRQSTIKGLLDARQQFQTEILPEIGDPIDSCVIPGIVLRKFIAHREMARSILSPKLLLLSGALELECPNLFQLHTDIKKENDFLESAVDRILQLAPDICLVERTVARCALLRLQEENITLVCNVSMEDLTKLAIHTNAKIVQNILEVTQSCLGSCIEFSVLPVKNPTNTNNARKPFPLMIFKACSSLTASTAVLRGGSEHDLELVKEVLSFAVFAAYRLHLETAFLSDSLSITAASTTAFGIEGFASEQWKDICSSIVQKCVQETKNHQSNEAVEFVSPVISKWTSHQSHQSVFQRHEFSFPVLDLETSFLISKGQNQSSETNSITSTGLSLNPAESKIQSETKTRVAAIQPSLTNCNKEIQCPGTTSFDVYGGSASTPSSQIDNNNAQIDGEWCPWRTWSDVESLRKSFDPIPATQTQYSDSFTDHQQVKGNIMQQQKFAASFAKRNHIRGKLCEESHVKSIQFCSEGDISLMEFLKSISADSKKLCPAGCGGGNASHLLTVFHGAIRLAISVVPVPEDKIFPNSDSEIWLWTRPKGVQKSPMNSVSRIALSEEAKSLSLGQFLQLAFNTPYLKVFGRQLFLEHVLYFGFGETAACVLEDRIQLKSVTLPEPVLDYHTPLQIQWVQEAGQQILEEADLVYESVEKLCLSSPVRRKDSFKSPGGGGTTDESSKKTSESFAHESYMKFSLIPEIKEEREKFRSEVQTIMNEVLIQSVNGGKISNNEILESFLKLNALWRQLGINALSCSATMDCSLDHKSWKLSLTKSSQLEGRISRIGTRVSAPVGSGTNQVSRTPNASPERSPSVGDLHQLDSGDIQDSASTTETHPIDSMAFDGVITDSPFLSMIHEPFTRCSYEKDSSTQDQNLPVRIPSTPSCSTDDGLERLHSLNALMDDSRDNNCVKLKRNSSIGVMQMLDREVQLFYEERLTEANTQSSVSFNQHRSVSLPQSPRETTLLNQLDRRLDLSLYDDEKPLCVEDEDLDSNMTTDLHSSMLPSPFQQLPDPHGHQSSPLETGGNEVLITGPITPGIELSCRAMFPVGSDGLVIPVFESEPASIIAHVLSSISYHKELQQYFEILNSRQRNYDGSIDFEAQNLTTTMSPRPSSGPNLDVNFCRQSGPSELMQRGGKSRMNVASHIVQRLEDNPPGASTSSARFEVVSYFAPQFSKLRNRCIDGGERSFIMSMCRSKKWKTDGGKSKSYFAKTLDDRFIIKGVSKSEKASFLEQLGPCYFDYMQGQLRKKEDVSLAKILGLFQVSMKSTNNRNGRVDQNSESTDLGKDWMLDLIVMENVFYNRDCSSIYDLKGCHRTRFNSEAEKQKTTDHRPLVFLDSNLKKHNVKSPPLLVSQVSWNGLRETLCRDTNFLESNSVMDYSLLVGLDRSSNSLVISIIDYIRQFTWDKRLESWVKSSGLMGGEVNEDPTIISPKSYKDRFISTVLGYFTIVPMYDDPQ